MNNNTQFELSAGGAKQDAENAKDWLWPGASDYNDYGHDSSLKGGKLFRSRGSSLPGGSMAPEDLYRWKLLFKKNFLKKPRPITPIYCVNDTVVQCVIVIKI